MEEDNEEVDLHYKVCLADFGYACGENESLEILRMRCGTPNYLDPEVLNGGIFTFKSDIFSLGSVLFTLLSGLKLYPGEDQFQILANNECKDPTQFLYPEIFTHYSSECKELLTKMIKPLSNGRLTAE